MLFKFSFHILGSPSSQSGHFSHSSQAWKRENIILLCVIHIVLHIVIHCNTHYVSYFSLQGLFYWLTSGLQNCLDLWPDQNDNIGKKGLEKRWRSNKTEPMELLWENAIFEYRRTICVETQPEKQRILRQDTKSPEQSCLREQTNVKGHILPKYLLTDREQKMIKEIHE